MKTTSDQKTVLLFNAPPRVGKDFACQHLRDTHSVNTYKFAAPLYQHVADICNLTLSELASRYETSKDQVFSHGMTLRELFIHVSEDVLKNKHGPYCFAEKLLKQINQDQGSVVSVSDCGFTEEVDFLAKNSSHRYIIVQLHRDGYDFKMDSRRYVTHPNMSLCVIRECDDALLSRVSELYNLIINTRDF